jgi:hypothetical protein
LLVDFFGPDCKLHAGFGFPTQPCSILFTFKPLCCSSQPQKLPSVTDAPHAKYQMDSQPQPLQKRQGTIHGIRLQPDRVPAIRCQGANHLEQPLHILFSSGHPEIPYNLILTVSLNDLERRYKVTVVTFPGIDERRKVV